MYEKLDRNDLIEHGVVDIQNDDVYVYGAKGKVRKCAVTKIITKRKYVQDKEFPKVQFVSKKTGKMIAFTLARIKYAWFYGEVPAGKVVYHIDHDPFNNDINNLDLVPLAEMAARRFM